MNNDKLHHAKQKMEQAKFRRMMQENREKKAKSDLDFRRQVIVGELLIKHFPILLNFTPRVTDEENRMEFAPLEQMLEALAQYQITYKEMEGASLELQKQDGN